MQLSVTPPPTDLAALLLTASGPTGAATAEGGAATPPFSGFATLLDDSTGMHGEGESPQGEDMIPAEADAASLLASQVAAAWPFVRLAPITEPPMSEPVQQAEPPGSPAGTAVQANAEAFMAANSARERVEASETPTLQANAGSSSAHAFLASGPTATAKASDVKAVSAETVHVVSGAAQRGVGRTNGVPAPEQTRENAGTAPRLAASRAHAASAAVSAERGSEVIDAAPRTLETAVTLPQITAENATLQQEHAPVSAALPAATASGSFAPAAPAMHLVTRHQAEAATTTDSQYPSSSSAASALTEWPLTASTRTAAEPDFAGFASFAAETVTSAHQLSAKPLSERADHSSAATPAAPPSPHAPVAVAVERVQSRPEEVAVFPGLERDAAAAGRRMGGETNPRENSATAPRGMAVSSSPMPATAAPGLAAPQPSMVSPVIPSRGEMPPREAMHAAEAFRSEGGAKIAVPALQIPSSQIVGAEPPAKTFVATAGKRVTEAVAGLGTSVAKPTDAMRSASTLPQTPAAAHDPVALAAAPATEVSFDLSLEPGVAPETISTAHRAVEAVLTAVHRFAAKDHHAVNLQFTVGGSDLTVRVEMRADEVRATFTTDSAELRAALAHEWQSVPATTADRSLRLAAPTFASNDAGQAGASGDHQGSRHRDSSTRLDQEPFSLVSNAARGSRSSSFASVAAATPGPRAPHGTSRHLHTLA